MSYHSILSKEAYNHAVKTSLVLVGAALHNLGQFYLVEKKLDAAYACYEGKILLGKIMSSFIYTGFSFSKPRFPGLEQRRENSNPRSTTTISSYAATIFLSIHD
ncbi:hypothetical protein Tco_1009050 [Tanacetum coccineum]